MRNNIYRPTLAKISSEAVKNNILNIRKLVGKEKYLCCMVKANAYGHDYRLISKVCQDEKIDSLGVVSVEEAIFIREGNINLPILVFGAFDLETLQVMKDLRITPVVSDELQWKILKKFNDKELAFHFEFNTGMNRSGFRVEDANDLLEDWKPTELKLEGVCSHFLDGEDFLSDHGYSKIQINKFSNVKKLFASTGCIFHSYKSFPSIIAGETGNAAEIDGLRLGISLYGISPLKYHSNILLEPVLKLVSKITSARIVKSGEVVSYGATWKAKKDSIVGTVPIGYGDGYHRSNSNKAHMLFRGQKVPQIGTICMDYTMVDLSEVIDEKEIFDIINNEEVVIIGQQGEEEISAKSIAAWTNTIPYEVLTSISSRIPRILS